MKKNTVADEYIAAMIIFISMSAAFLGLVWFAFWGAAMLIAVSPFWGWSIAGMMVVGAWGTLIAWSIRIINNSRTNYDG
jgi:hypothetical protein